MGEEANTIAIAKDGDLVTLINVFNCKPQNQQRLIR
jgi:hypothetical protein